MLKCIILHIIGLKFQYSPAITAHYQYQPRDSFTLASIYGFLSLNLIDNYHFTQLMSIK